MSGSPLPPLLVAWVVSAGCGSSSRSSPPHAAPEARVSAGSITGAPAPSSSPASAAASPRLSPAAQELLDAHNGYRAKHCAAPLAWSPRLAESAQRWANTLEKKGCMFGHSGAKYGENLAAGTTGALPPEAAVAMWYEEVKRYSFRKPGFSMETGHFTQLVWRDTTEVGCGMTQCKGMDIWVCQYDPPGNWEGKYREQVLPASCRKGR